MQKTRQPMSNAKAIAIGSLVVNGPVLFLLCAPVVIYILAPRFAWVTFAYPLFFVGAWLWWSLTVPRWRIWAYEHVASAQELKRAAVAANLTWPSGSFFEKTEIKSSAIRYREKQLERRKP
jgi:hypothetical protein